MSDSIWSDAAALFACGPRPGGNSDKAVGLFERGLGQGGGHGRTLWLRQYQIQRCRGCHRCAHDPRGACFLADDDESSAVFEPLLTAPLVFMASPIYFYHLPAMFKGFIDRGQSYYLRKARGDAALASLPRRKAYVVLVAGRPRGEKLFEGALLTLKYFFDPFNLELAVPLTLRGIDERGDLTADEAASAAVVEYGRAAASEVAWGGRES